MLNNYQRLSQADHSNLLCHGTSLYSSLLLILEQQGRLVTRALATDLRDSFYRLIWRRCKQERKLNIIFLRSSYYIV